MTILFFVIVGGVYFGYRTMRKRGMFGDRRGRAAGKGYERMELGRV
jgi:hypothetical protein